MSKTTMLPLSKHIDVSQNFPYHKLGCVSVAVAAQDCVRLFHRTSRADCIRNRSEFNCSSQLYALICFLKQISACSEIYTTSGTPRRTDFVLSTTGKPHTTILTSTTSIYHRSIAWVHVGEALVQQAQHGASGTLISRMEDVLGANMSSIMRSFVTAFLSWTRWP